MKIAFAAAISAARNGAKVVLVERGISLGGLAFSTKLLNKFGTIPKF